jgi:hypothetical protein
MLFDTLRLYIPASSYAVQPLRLHPILLISILLYCYEQLSGWVLKVEQMMMVKEEENVKQRLFFMH